MASNKISFDWGSIVIIKETAPQCFKPGSKGSICGIRSIDSDEVASQFNQPIGSELFLVEFDNGDTLEIPIIFLCAA